MRYIALLLSMLTMISCGGDAPAKRGLPAYREGEVIVKFRTGTEKVQRQYVHNTLHVSTFRRTGPEGFERVRLPQDMSVEEAVKRYTANPEVEYAEPNYIVRVSAVPDDPGFTQQWWLHNSGQSVDGVTGTAGADIDAPAAWDIATGSSVIVAVIDTGADTRHPDLAGNLVAGHDFLDNDSDPDDLNGHGTHVSGIIGAVGNNLAGISGVNWSAKIMPLKVLDQNGEGTIADIMDAISFAASKNVTIVNMSFGGMDYSRALYDSIKGLPGMLFVASAGNSMSDLELIPEYPASFELPNIISVAATDQDDNLASFSNYGISSVDLGAPGIHILSTIPSFTTGVTYLGAHRVVYLSYGLECISGDPARTGVMKRALDFEGTSPGDRILLVDDDGGDHFETFYTQALQDLGYPFDVYEVPWRADGPDLTTLSGYALVIWFTGGEYRNTLTSPDQENLRSYLDHGGRLFVSGQDIGFEIGGGDFYRDCLHASYVTDDALGNAYTGLNVFTGLFVELPVVCGDRGVSQYRLSADAVIPSGSESAAAFSVQYGDAYQFLDGTSMAAPVVSGIAALVSSQSGNPGADQVKSTILGSVDPKPSLQGKTLTGGRVNAFKALTYLIPPSNLRIRAQGKTAVLTWTDNSAGRAGFRIERKITGGEFTEIATVAPNQTSYEDAGLTTGETYAYRVRAFNTLSGSTYSNEVAVTLSRGSNGGGGGGCSIGEAPNTQSAIADTLVIGAPLVIVLFIKRLRRQKPGRCF